MTLPASTNSGDLLIDCNVTIEFVGVLLQMTVRRGKRGIVSHLLLFLFLRLIFLFRIIINNILMV